MSSESPISKVRESAKPKLKPRGGSRKGIPNKITRDLRESILAAANAAHDDGIVGYLKQQARDNPNSFMALLGKTVPKEITGKDGKDLFPTKIKIELVSP